MPNLLFRKRDDPQHLSCPLLIMAFLSVQDKVISTKVITGKQSSSVNGGYKPATMTNKGIKQILR
jgi:hypothetical protein